MPYSIINILSGVAHDDHLYVRNNCDSISSGITSLETENFKSACEHEKTWKSSRFMTVKQWTWNERDLSVKVTLKIAVSQFTIAEFWPDQNFDDNSFEALESSVELSRKLIS